MGVTYDTGALVAAERGERRMWARHRALLLARQVPTVPAPVVAQAWRGGRHQELLSRLLVGCEVEVLDEARARSAGALAARAGTGDVVDACVVDGALRRGDVVVSADPSDLGALATARSASLAVEAP